MAGLAVDPFVGTEEWKSVGGIGVRISYSSESRNFRDQCCRDGEAYLMETGMTTNETRNTTEGILISKK